MISIVMVYIDVVPLSSLQEIEKCLYILVLIIYEQGSNIIVNKCVTLQKLEHLN